MTIAEDVYAAARRYGIDPDIFYRQIEAESGFAPDVIDYSRGSYAGAMGIAQFMPGTAAQYGVKFYDNNYLDDLDGAARLMRDLLAQFGRYDWALAAYNAGPQTVIDYGGVPPPSFADGQTYNYVQSILSGVMPGAPNTGEPPTGGMTALTDPDYIAARAKWNELDAKIYAWEEYAKGMVAAGQTPDISKMPTAAEYEEHGRLGNFLNDMDDWYAANGGGTGAGDITGAWDYINKNDPRVIEAENAANRYARDLQARTLAAQQAVEEQQALQSRMTAATDSTNTFWEANAEGRRAAVPTTAPSKIDSGSVLFQKALDTIKAGLPEVPDMPVPKQLTVEEILGGSGGGGGAGVPGGKPTLPTAKPTLISPDDTTGSIVPSGEPGSQFGPNGVPVKPSGSILNEWTGPRSFGRPKPASQKQAAAAGGSLNPKDFIYQGRRA